jgi:hypothetical protein
MPSTFGRFDTGISPAFSSGSDLCLTSGGFGFGFGFGGGSSGFVGFVWNGPRGNLGSVGGGFTRILALASWSSLSRCFIGSGAVGRGMGRLELSNKMANYLAFHLFLMQEKRGRALLPLPRKATVVPPLPYH